MQLCQGKLIHASWGAAMDTAVSRCEASSIHHVISNTCLYLLRITNIILFLVIVIVVI